MSTVVFKHDWVEMSGLDLPHIQKTMANLEIRVCDEVVTQVVDSGQKVSRDHVTVSLYSLAEWIAANWWSLVAESYTPGRTTQQGYDSRHNMRHAGEGFAFPSLSIIPSGRYVRLVWREMPLTFQKLRFISKGQRTVLTEGVLQELREFVSIVIGRLDSQGISETWLHHEWEQILSMEMPYQKGCKFAAAMGMDPFDLDINQQETMRRVLSESKKLGVDRNELASVLRLADTQELLDLLRKGTDLLRTGPHTDPQKLPFPRTKEVLQPSKPPYEQGYDLAQSVRKDFSPNGGRVKLEDYFGNPPQEQPTIWPPLSRYSIDGLVQEDEPGRIACATTKNRSDSVRFTLARAIGHSFMSKRSSTGLLTASQTDTQKFTRAFAAELLAPSSDLRERVAYCSDSIPEELVEDLAEEYQVSAYVVQHQIQNHDLGTIAAI